MPRKIKKIEKLDIDLFPNKKGKYEEDRAKYISDYEEYEKWYSTGFFWWWRAGRDVKKPDVGEAKWNKKYPEGYESWIVNNYKLTTTGQQEVIDKMNELVDIVNKLWETIITKTKPWKQKK